MNKETFRYHLLIPALTSLLVLGLHAAGAFQRVEWMSYDQRMQWLRADAAPHPDIAVILIDEASLRAMDPLVGRFPWPRSVYADLIEFLSLGQARAAVFDILFSEHQRDAAEAGVSPDDRRLIDATRAAGNVYHAFQLTAEEGDEGAGPPVAAPLPDDFRNRFQWPSASVPVTRNNDYALPIAGLYQAARGMGAVGLQPDADGIHRRISAVHTYRGEPYPALFLAPFGEAARDGADAGMLINLYGRFRPYSISGVFASIQAMRAGDVEKMRIMPDEFHGKTVFIGASAIGLEDTKATPLSPATPGVLLHAAAASNLLSNEALRPASTGVTAALVIAAALLTVIALRRARAYFQAVIPLGIAFVYVLFAVWSFRQGYALEMTPPLAAVGLTWLVTLGHLSVTEGRDKRRIRKMLAQYVSPAVLADVLARREDRVAAEVGRREQLSILFSDIRGFTAISEELAPEQIVDLLNCYFSEMTEIVFARRGTLDKFIGDAIMAFWGAPLRTPDHARFAVTAAMEMTRRLPRVNERLRARGYPALRIGAGINTGMAVLGNIGSEKKLDYTVIGDNVNLASRVEGLTSRYACPVLITEYTRRELGGEFPCACVDLVRVKGKHAPVAIYRPLALPGDPAEQRAEAVRLENAFEQGFTHYRAQRWDEALAVYNTLAGDPVAEIFIQRCQTYRAQPPPPGWDGVHTLATK